MMLAFIALLCIVKRGFARAILDALKPGPYDGDASGWEA